jgi:hypothetical protein
MTNPLNLSAETREKLEARSEKFRNEMNAMQRSLKRDATIFGAIKLAIVVGGAVALVKIIREK